MINIVFHVLKIIYRNDATTYTVAEVKISKHPEAVTIPTASPTISGIFKNINQGDEIDALGDWTNTGKHGFQFQVKSSSIKFSEKDKGIVKSIAKFVKGIGTNTAEKIVEEFKKDTYNTILENPERLLKIKGITQNKANRIYRAIKHHSRYVELREFLLPLGVTNMEVVTLYEELGQDSITIIKKNPYVLSKCSTIKFNTVDRIACQLGFQANNKERIKRGIMEYIEYKMENNGDMFVCKDVIITDLSDFLNKFKTFEEVALTTQEILSLLEILCLQKKIIIEDEEYIYISFYSHIENTIVKEVIKIIMSKTVPIASKDKIESFLEKYNKSEGINLGKNQKQAIIMAMKNRISIITGGPGTGKTETIKAIINTIKTLNPELNIELAAPTGRAAKRMSEMTGMEAKTIHRLIGLNNFQKNETELIPIDADYLVIDEASMVDAYLFHSLLTVITNNTRILIVGDYEQLPSVGAGLILRDLINSNRIPTTKLEQIFRQAIDSQITTNAHKIIKGLKNIDLDGINSDFFFINQPNKEKIVELILLSIDRLLETGKKLEDIQVISVMNKGTLGIEELNKRIQDRYNPREEGKMMEVNIGIRLIRIGDRVMQTVNNYDLGVFNGEVGTIIAIECIGNSKEIIVDFGDKEFIYQENDVKQLVLAYAITVHKAQGSEFPIVIMPFHSSLSFLLYRNIIYTGWTRAKRQLINIGDIQELYKGIDRVENNVRNSRIIEKLQVEYQKEIDDSITINDVYFAYMPFNENVISNIINFEKQRLLDLIDKLKYIAAKYRIENFNTTIKEMRELQKVASEEDGEIIKEYKRVASKIGKLEGFLSYLLKKYKRFDHGTSFNIPYKLNSKGYATLQKIQIPFYSFEEIKEIISFEPVVLYLKQNELKNLDVVLQCWEIEDDINNMFIFYNLERLGVMFLVIGNKLYILREDNSRNVGRDCSVYNKGRNKLRLINNQTEQLTNLTKNMKLLNTFVMPIN